MNRIEKLMKALPEGADAALITSDVNRRYFTGLGSTAGTLLAFRDAAYFIIDFRQNLQTAPAILCLDNVIFIF